MVEILNRTREVDNRVDRICSLEAGRAAVDQRLFPRGPRVGLPRVPWTILPSCLSNVRIGSLGLLSFCLGDFLCLFFIGSPSIQW
jgi:hypothetical protein